MRRAAVLSALLATLLTALLLTPAPAPAAVPSERVWKADVRKAMAGSLDYLEQRAARAAKGEMLAINLDIDNTMLATRYAPGRAVFPVLQFARKARSLGMAVFVNTARLEEKRASTLAEFDAAGYRIDGLCMRDLGEGKVKSKTECRASFREQGYTLVANVGNNVTDFTGGGFEKAYRLPNYNKQLT